MGLRKEDVRIMIVEDETEIAELIAENLKTAGLTQPDLVTSGHDAYNLCTQSLREKRPIHIIVSDCNMPKMTGIDLLEKVRKNGVLKEIPFIMLTANSDRENIERAIRAGVTDYLVKPINFGMLTKRIASLIQKLGVKE